MARIFIRAGALRSIALVAAIVAAALNAKGLGARPDGFFDGPH